MINGPDVASYQHPSGAPIDWHKVARTGAEFAIVKATEGTSYRNPWFRADYNGSRRAGLVRGSYHFARPGYPIVRTARAQARYYVDRLGTSAGTNRTLPPALDLELSGGLSRGPLVAWAQTFLLEVRRLTGRVPLLYTYPSFWSSSLGDPAALERFPLWMASYSGEPDAATTLWQYTSRASVRGIRGAVDMSRLTASPESWQVLSDGRIANPWPAAVPGAPQQVRAVGADSAATVSWLPPDSGSDPVSGYQVTASTLDPTTGQPTLVASTSVDALHFSARIGGLTNGTPYTFSVTATNRRGVGAAASTAAVTPLVPVTMTVDAPAQTTYGDDARVRVRLSRSDSGQLLPGREVALEQRDPVTGDWTAVKTLTTGERGWAGVRLTQPQHSTALRFTFAAPEGWEGARRTVPVVVTNGAAAALSRSRVHSGHRVRISGVIAPAVGGIEVRQQAYYRHHWHVLQRGVTATDGSYVFSFAPTTKVKTTKRYRIVVAGFDGRSRGVSAVLDLLVRP
ncbi:MAG TPA: GH25 family lysozyme [Mycobacteriales bacterium]|nr:GH25 family lysozyme [Mycobacteriales bacterium]